MPALQRARKDARVDCEAREGTRIDRPGGVIWRMRADPLGRAGQSTKSATHLIKASVETALGLRPKVDVFGTDYPTADGTCIRDYTHVSDLVRAHCDALAYLRGGASPPRSIAVAAAASPCSR